MHLLAEVAAESAWINSRAFPGVTLLYSSLLVHPAVGWVVKGVGQGQDGLWTAILGRQDPVRQPPGIVP